MRGSILFAVNASPFVAFAAQIFGKWRKDLTVILYFQRPATRLVRLLGGLHRVLRARNVHYATENLQMQRQYESSLRVRCHIVPSPIRSGGASSRRREPPYAAVVLGQPRLEKGFDIFVHALDHLKGTLRSGRLRIVVQTIETQMAGEGIRPHVHRLCELAKECSSISVSTRALSPEEYDRLLDGSDFVILPYRFASYAHRSSGIAIESLANCLPLVVTQGLSFAPLATEFGAAVTVPDGDAVALAEGVREMLENMPIYRANAERAAERLRNEHSIAHVSSRLVSIAERPNRSL